MSTSPLLDEKVVEISETLRRADVRHAFGGAIALAYYAEPRATLDIDINIFVDAELAKPVLERLADMGIVARPDDGDPFENVLRSGQVRLIWDRTLVDLFFVNHDFHRACAKRVREVSLVDNEITILAAEDLVMFKIAFNRRKDWLDIEQVLFATAGSFDLNHLRTWAARFFDANDPRLVDLEEVIDRILGPEA